MTGCTSPRSPGQGGRWPWGEVAPPKLAVLAASPSYPLHGDRRPRGAAFSPQTLFGGFCPALCPIVRDQAPGNNPPSTASPVAGVPGLGSLPTPCPLPGPLLLAHPLPRATGREVLHPLPGWLGEPWSHSSPAVFPDGVRPDPALRILGKMLLKKKPSCQRLRP